MKTTVKREGDKVWLEGVTGWFVGDKESSVHAAQEAIMQAAGYDLSYDYLLGVSALAFRMQLFKDCYCGSSRHPHCGFPCVARSTLALPMTFRQFEAKPTEPEKIAEARRAIVASINRGLPVQYGSEEDGVIIGYQKDGAEWLCLHPWHGGSKQVFVESKWPWGVMIFLEPKPAMPSRRDLALGALQQAVAMANAQEAGGYYVGFKAWEEYLRSLQALETVDEKARQQAMQVNAWIYECLAQYRASAARYLKSVAGEFDPAPAQHLNRAAELYEQVANHVLRDETHCVVTIAPYPHMLKNGQAWTAAMRQDQRQRLAAALPLERQAIAEITAALQLLQPSAPAP